MNRYLAVPDKGRTHHFSRFKGVNLNHGLSLRELFSFAYLKLLCKLLPFKLDQLNLNQVKF